MARKVLTNAQWAELAPLFPRKGPQAKRRLRVEGILWIHRPGAPWRDLPACFGKWGTVQSCFCRWDDNGLWARLWQKLRDTLGEDHEALYNRQRLPSRAPPQRARRPASKPLGARAAGAAPKCMCSATRWAIPWRRS